MDSITKKTILLVDDEALIAMSEKIELEKYGYSVRTVTTGEQAVEAIQRSPDVDLILMDIDLGAGIDGTEAAEIILKDHDIPIVFLSSHTDPEVVGKTEKITSYGYVVKNSSLAVLDASIKMAFKLFEARRQVTDTFTHSINGLCVHRAIRDKSGKLHDCEYVRVNSAFEQHTGFSSEKLIGRTIRELFSEADAEPVVRLHDDILSGSADARQEIYFAPTQHWHEMSVFPTQGDTFTVVEQNITERKKAEEELQRTHTILTRQQETAPYGVLVVDEDDQIVSFNQVFADIWKIPDEVMALQSGAKVRAYILPQLPDPAGFVEEIATLYASRQTEESKEIRLTDGRTLIRYSYPMFSDRGRYLGRVWYYQDITERKQMEETLRESVDCFDELVRMIPVGVYVVWIRADGRMEFEYVSDRWCDIHKLCGEDALADAEKVNDQAHPDERDAFLERNRQAAGDHKPFLWEGRFIVGDGELRWLRIESTPCVFDNADTRWFGVTQDITERKQAEQEVQRQLAEKETLFREGQHRIKNNIAQLESLLSLQAGSADDIGVKSALREAISRVQSTRILYEKLVVSEGHQQVSIKEYLESVIESHAEVYNDHAGASIEKRIADFSVSSKKAILIGIIVNELLTNAFKYAFKNREEGRVLIKLEKTDNRVILIVQDDGIGFKSRGAAHDSSTGFGLTLTQMLAEQLGGTFSIKNENGTRSVVEFEI